MGITGLLPLLKDVQRERNVKDYAGQTLGIDAYVWLHRGAYGCAAKLAMGEFTTSYVKYAMTRIEMLRFHGVVPYVVFDGDRLPAKARTEDDRETRRQESRDMAKKLLEQGKKKQAHDVFAKCVDVTPEMAFQLIKALREAGVDYIVAPFEADAQLAYLEKSGVIAGVITEDSDLLVFGCRTVLYKLDIDGSCVEIKQERLTSCKALPLLGFTQAQFRQMAIMSGCDYLESVPGIGLKSAHRLLRKHSTVAKALQAARMEGKRVPASYAEDFATAERTFVYQRVFARAADGSVRLVTLTSLDNLDEAERALIEAHECIGAPISDAEAKGIADGDIDPISRRPIVDLAPAPAKPAASKQAFSSAARKPFKQSPFIKAAVPAKDPRQMGITGFFARQPGSSSRRPLREKPGNSIQAAADAAFKRVVQLQQPPKRKHEEEMGNEAGSSKQRLISPPSEVKSKFFGAAPARARRTPSPAGSEGADVASPTSGVEQAGASPELEDDDDCMIIEPGAMEPSSAGVHVGFASPSAAKRARQSFSPFDNDEGIISSPVTSLPDVAGPSSPRRTMSICEELDDDDDEDEEMSDPIETFESPSRAVRKATSTSKLAPAPARSRSRISFDFTSDDDEDGKPSAAKEGVSAKLFEQFAFDAKRPSAARSSTTPNFRAATAAGSKLDLRTPRSISNGTVDTSVKPAAATASTSAKRALTKPLQFGSSVTPKMEQQQQAPLQRRGASVAAATLKLRSPVKTPITPAAAAAAARPHSTVKRSNSALDFAKPAAASGSGSALLQTFKFTPAAAAKKDK